MRTGSLRPSGFFVVRTPLLSFDEFLRWTDHTEPPVVLREILSRPEVLDALWLASPSLVGALNGPDEERARKALPALTSYFARMCSRATPFGLFAGLGVGHFGASTCLDVADVADCRRHSRLDMDFLSVLVADLEQELEIRRLVQWWPNSSIYCAGGRLHLAAARLAGEERTYDLVAVHQTDALAGTLERARSGASVDALAEALVTSGVTYVEAEEFVLRLIDAQLLVSDLALSVTGAEPIDVLLSTLPEHPRTTALAKSLGEVCTGLRAIDDKGLGATPDDYGNVRAHLVGLPSEAREGRLFQVDMIKPAPGASLGPEPLAEIVRAVGILQRLARRSRPGDPLDQFRGAFVERYEDQEVPLVEALDAEIGIGFGPVSRPEGSSLLEGLDVGPPRRAEPTFGARETLLLRMLARALADGKKEISLDSADLEALAPEEPPELPDSMEVLAVLAASSVEAADQGDFRLLVRVVLGPPGVSVLGRFCHADQHLHRHVQEHVRAEEACRPDAAFAEVVHLPQGRAGNILCRPVLRPYEIPYVGRSGAPADSQVPASDLWVSVRDRKVVLRSQRLEREVIPRSTTAHDFTANSLAIYHFLCALQNQGTADRLGWDWGPLAAAPYLPRVTSGRLVLARAQWHLEPAEVAELPALRAAGRLPRFVALADGDDLVIDLDNPLSVGVVRHHAAGRPSTTLVEMFPGPEDLCAAGPGGRYVHDLVVPLVRPPAAAVASGPATRRPAVRRSFAPGSEWFYAKLYTGTATADRVLVDLVGPVVAEAMRLGVADSWHFLRYGDPEWHLRLRMHGDAAAMLPLLDAAAVPFLGDRRIWRVQVDTYVRELERYGGDDGMALSEQWFHADSEAVLAVLRGYGGDAGHDARWRLTLLGIDMLLSDVGFDLPGKEAWAKQRRQAFAEEFRVSGRLKGQLGDVYRKQRRSLDGLLEGPQDHGHFLSPGVDVLRRRSERVQPLVRTMHERGLEVSDLASSYAHMHVNRLLRSSHRAQELVIYDLLHRLYVSRIARSRTD